MTTEVVVVNSTSTVVSENTQTNTIEITAQGPAGPPGGALTIQDEGVSEGLLTDKINFVGSTVSVANDTINEIATITVNAADPGANTNITSMTGITGGISTADFVQFDTAAVGTGAIGKLLWNDTDGTLEFQMKGGNVTLQIGQEQVLRVTNQYGSTISDGQAVYITGSTGNHLNVTLAQANTEAASSKTLAIVTEPIANNQSGFATTSGLVRNFNTSALTEGAAIWLSPTVPGGLTSTKPVAPDNSVLIGWCVRQHATVGVIYVHISNGYELEELHNVLITAASNKQVLRYDSATGLWKNATISPTVTLAGAVTGSGTMTDLGSVTITTTATSDPTLTLSGDASGSVTFTNLGDATLAVTVADNSHNHTIANVTGLQTELDTKAPLASPTFTGTVTLPSTTSVGTVSATEIGYLDGVTSGIQAQIDTKLASSSYTAADVLTKIKTVDGSGSGLDADLLDGQSSAYYTAINDRLGYTAENTANKGVAGGYAALDGAGMVPSTQLPSYVDDVLEYANTAAFPVTGETGKIYVAIDTSKTYRWSGSVYVEISASPGSTDSIPEGATNLYFTTSRARQSVSAGTGISYNNSTGVITNSAPDRTVAITGSGTTSVTGTYPNFTVSSGDAYTGTVTSVAASGGTTGLTFSGGPITTSGTLTLGGTLVVANGGTGATTLTGYVKGNGTAAFTASATIPTTDLYGTISLTTQVSGVLGAANGGTGNSTYTIGDILYASGATTLSKLADVATGNALISGGVGVAPSYGKIGLTTHVSGTLPVANGGTGATSLTSGYLVKGNGTSAVTASVVYDTGTNVGIGTSSPGAKLHVRPTTDVNHLFSFSGASATYLAVNDAGSAYVDWLGYANTFQFYTASTERMRITSGGNVGIATTTPQRPLHVAYLSTAVGAYTAVLQGQTGGYGAGVSFQSQLTGGSLAEMARITADGEAAWNTTASTQDAGLRFYTALDGAVAEKMRLSSAGYVGIGTSAPGLPLDIGTADAGARVYPSTTTNNAYWRAQNAGGTAYLGLDSSAGGLTTAYALNVYHSGAYPICFGTNSTERMRIDSAGNVGIGTTSPQKKLAVSDGGNIGFEVSPNDAAAGYTRLINYNRATSVYAPVRYEGSTQTWYVGTAGTTRAMDIDSAGNVGIGVTPSGANLPTIQSTYGLFTGSSQINVAGNAYYNGGWKYVNTAAASLYFQGSGAHNWQIAPSGTAGAAVGFTQAMTLDASGVLLVNRTGSSGFGKLNVDGGADFTGGNVYLARDTGTVKIGTTDTGGKITVYSTTSTPAIYCRGTTDARASATTQTSGTSYYDYFTYNGTAVGSITSTGTTTAFNTTSDARLKENIADADDASALVDSIKIRKFDWKASGEHQRHGVIAQELMEVAPEAVTPGRTEDDMMSVDYSKLVPMLIKEVQSLRARVAQLEGK